MILYCYYHANGHRKSSFLEKHNTSRIQDLAAYKAYCDSATSKLSGVKGNKSEVDTTDVQIEVTKRRRPDSTNKMVQKKMEVSPKEINPGPAKKSDRELSPVSLLAKGHQRCFRKCSTQISSWGRHLFTELDV